MTLMSEENLRYCAMCGQPLEKHQKKFCSRACYSLFQIRQRDKNKKSEAEEMQNEVVGLDQFYAELRNRYSSRDSNGLRNAKNIGRVSI